MIVETGEFLCYGGDIHGIGELGREANGGSGQSRGWYRIIFLIGVIRKYYEQWEDCRASLGHKMAIFQALPSSSPPMSESRPSMRRKSSAQNLLSSMSSFKPANGPVNAATVGSISSAASVAYTASTATVTSGREWDGQSVHSDTLSSGATLVGTGTPVIAQGASVEYLRDLVQKRIITLTYMRNIHEGCVYSILMLRFRAHS